MHAVILVPVTFPPQAVFHSLTLQYKSLINSHPEPLQPKEKVLSAMRRNRNNIGNSEKRSVIIPFPYAINQTSGHQENFSHVLLSFIQLMALLCSLMSSEAGTWKTLSCPKPRYPDSNRSWAPGFNVPDRCPPQPVSLVWWGWLASPSPDLLLWMRSEKAFLTAKPRSLQLRGLWCSVAGDVGWQELSLMSHRKAWRRLLWNRLCSPKPPPSLMPIKAIQGVLEGGVKGIALPVFPQARSKWQCRMQGVSLASWIKVLWHTQERGPDIASKYMAVLDPRWWHVDVLCESQGAAERTPPNTAMP